MSAGELARLAARPPVAAAPAFIPVPPDADGVLDLAAAVAAGEVEPVPNPFRIRYRPPRPERRLVVRVAGVACPAGDPAAACCVLNDATCSPGDSYAGLTVASVDTAAVDLVSGRYRLRLPVDQPITIRLP